MCDRKEIEASECEQPSMRQTPEDAVVMAVARELLEKYRTAFEELAK